MNLLTVIMLSIWIISFAIITIMERYNGRTYEDYGFDDPVAYDMYSFIIAPIALLIGCCIIGYYILISKHKRHNKTV